MAKVVEPKVNVIDFGPSMTFEKGEEIALDNGEKIAFEEKTTIGPDDWVYGAAGITYQDIGTIPELLRKKAGIGDDGNKISKEEVERKMRNSLVNSAGAGHASMATTPGFWVMMEGISSKMVDSLFTGARYGSSLMPSGRRIPIETEQIVVPKSIQNKGGDELKLYLKASENNIKAYEQLQEKGVPKQDAAKIVQYGHRGGGFLFMPLETLISFSKDIELGRSKIPNEGKGIINDLEDFVRENGAKTVYEARREAPRTGCPNPGIFHTRTNLPSELADKNIDSPKILNCCGLSTPEMGKRVQEYLQHREDLFKNPEKVKKGWQKLLQELEEIVTDYNDSIRVTTFANSPWRLWGEVKRHRTLDQTAESIYHAVERAQSAISDYDDISPKEKLNQAEKVLGSVLSLPSEVTESSENLKLWTERFSESIKTYQTLVKAGIPESDAIYVVPRGIKLGITKVYDLYNLTTGMMSLRLCNDVEPEMRATTQAEYNLIKEDKRIPSAIKDLMMVKCHTTGFCHNPKHCRNIAEAVPRYDADMHKDIKEYRIEEIRKKLK